MAPIVVNARAAVRPEIGGVERWAREMAARLPALAPDRYFVARPPEALAFKAGHAWEQGALPVIARRRGASLIYNPAILAPLAWPRNVVQIHDAVALSHPEWYSRAYVAYQRALLPRIARRAALVITGSRFAREEIVSVLGVPAERIAIVPGGVDERFTPDADPEPARRAFRLERPYVLSVATPGARKNLGALEEVARGLEGIDVVVAGSGRDYIAGGEPAAGVRFLGYVPEAHLPGLYAGAEAFVLPSKHEGYGLTCLEAMACGTPVVTSDAGALPETVGDGGVLVADGRFADALEALLADDHARADVCSRGLERARRHGWGEAAARLDQLLTRLAGPPVDECSRATYPRKGNPAG